MKAQAEISWDWPVIACVLMWKLAPAGCTITRKDLGALPLDRVLIENRESDQIRFHWATLSEAQRMREPLARSGQKAGLTQLQGRWQKMAVVLLWKLAKDGCVLTQWDRDTVPADKILLAHGHSQDIEYRFHSRAEAARIQKSEFDHCGKIVMEHV